MNRTAQFITRTALFIALAVAAQLLRMVIPGAPTLLVGTLVNAVLMTATGITGILSGVIVSVIVPIVAFLQGQLPFPLFVPIVALGNVAISVVFGLIYPKGGMVKTAGALRAAVAVAAGSVVKFLLLFLLMTKWAIPLVAPEKAVATLSAAFSWSQLFTALMGGAIALLVLKVISRFVKDKNLA